jgi:hypothetical protein
VTLEIPRKLLCIIFTFVVVVVVVVVEVVVVVKVVVVVEVEVVDELEVSISVGKVSNIGVFLELDVSGGAVLISGSVGCSTRVVNSLNCFVSAEGADVFLVLAGKNHKTSRRVREKFTLHILHCSNNMILCWFCCRVLLKSGD